MFEKIEGLDEVDMTDFIPVENVCVRNSHTEYFYIQFFNMFMFFSNFLSVGVF